MRAYRAIATKRERINELRRKDYESDKERTKARRREYWKNRSDEAKARDQQRCQDYKKAWQQANKEKVAAAYKRYRERHREELKVRRVEREQANKAEYLARVKAYRDRNKSKINERKRKRGRQNWLAESCRKFGITPSTLEALEKWQDGKCAICRTPFTFGKPTVDHCHRTGRVRGLLCFHCNTGIGQLRDDPKLIRKAIRYLSGSGSRRQDAI